MSFSSVSRSWPARNGSRPPSLWPISPRSIADPPFTPLADSGRSSAIARMPSGCRNTRPPTASKRRGVPSLPRHPGSPRLGSGQPHCRATARPASHGRESRGRPGQGEGAQPPADRDVGGGAGAPSRCSEPGAQPAHSWRAVTCDSSTGKSTGPRRHGIEHGRRSGAARVRTRIPPVDPADVAAALPRAVHDRPGDARPAPAPPITSATRNPRW
jgi:hypothetical protein